LEVATLEEKKIGLLRERPLRARTRTLNKLNPHTVNPLLSPYPGGLIITKWRRSRTRRLEAMKQRSKVSGTIPDHFKRSFAVLND